MKIQLKHLYRITRYLKKKFDIHITFHFCHEVLIIEMDEYTLRNMIPMDDKNYFKTLSILYKYPKLIEKLLEEGKLERTNNYDNKIKYMEL